MSSPLTSIPTDRNGFGSARPTAHDVVEADRIVRAEAYSSEISRRPQLIDLAREMIDGVVSRDQATLGQRLWQALLREPLDMILSCMVADDAEGRLLRSNNPFSHLIGQTDPEIRSRTWKIARARLLDKRT